MFDPKNPAFWSDGSDQSQNNAFTLGHGAPLNWDKLQQYADARERTAKSVASNAAKGIKQGVAALNFRKKAQLRAPAPPHGGQYTRANGGDPSNKV